MSLSKPAQRLAVRRGKSPIGVVLAPHYRERMITVDQLLGFGVAALILIAIPGLGVGLAVTGEPR